MLTTLVMILVVAIRADESAARSPEVYKVSGSTFRIPCKTGDLPPDVVGVELWYSVNGGKSWSKAGDITRNQSHFEFAAKKAGEYHFAPRLRYKNGQISPESQEEFVSQLTVVVSFEDDLRRKGTLLTEEVEELDMELIRLELCLIRKEIKRLADEELTPEVERRIDQLRLRLRDIQARLGGDRSPSSPKEFFRPPSGVPNSHSKNPIIPVLPPFPPSLPELPPPRPPAR